MRKNKTINKIALLEIRLLSKTAREKYKRLLNHLIELKETTPTEKNVIFRLIYGDLLSFPADQQKDMLRILEKWGILRIKHVLLDPPFNDEISVISPLGSLRQALEFIGNSQFDTFPENKTTDKQNQNLVEDIKWPNNFKWKDDYIFDLGGQGEIKFSSKQNNKTRIYFEEIAKEQNRGNWVEVSEMAKKTGEKTGQVRIKLDQIRIKKIENKGYAHLITIESKGHYPGAYRLHPYPKTKLNV